MKQPMPAVWQTSGSGPTYFFQRTATSKAVRLSSSSPGKRAAQISAGVGRPGGWARLGSAMTF